MRRSAQAQQEQDAYGQLTACFKDWKVDKIPSDLGEDILVQIYEGGVSTGLTFYFQSKSCATFGTYKANAKSTALSYPLAVKDLEHWDGFTAPVFVIVWDVKLRRGCWASIPKLVAGLDAKQSGWRAQKTVNVAIPLANNTSKRGQHALRQTVASAMLPLLSTGKSIRISPTFRFPNTPAGHRAQAQLQRGIETGESFEVPGKYIEKFETSDWWRRAFGETKVSSLRFSTQPSNNVMTIALEAVSKARRASIPIKIRRIAAGTKLTKLSSEGLGGPHRLEVKIPPFVDGRCDVEVSVTVTFPSPSLHDSIEACRFLLTACEGGVISVVFPEEKRHRVDGLSIGWSLADLQTWDALLQKLAVIEANTRSLGRLVLPARLTGEDIDNVSSAYDALTTGEFSSVGTFRATLLRLPGKAPFPNSTDGMGLELTVDDYELTVLGVTIPLGEVHIRVVDKALLASAIDRLNASRAKHPELVLEHCAVRVTCPNALKILA